MNTIETRKANLLSRTSTAVLVASAIQLEGQKNLTAEERMTRAWIFDEIENRVGKITLDEEAEFERIYDETDSYMAALVALRPTLAA